MIVLHGAVYEKELYLWGESPCEEGMAPRRRLGRKPKVPKPEPFPYDAGSEAVRDALLEAGMDVQNKKIEPISAFAWIPAAGNTPAPSSPLIAELPDPKDLTEILPWSISAFPLGVSDCVEFLCLCAEKNILSPGLVAGSDLAFLTKAMHFAGALVVRQQFLPGLERVEKSYFARWEPVFSGLDLGRLTRLAGAMPQVCRAINHKADSVPEIAPTTLLSSFIGTMVDWFIRSAIFEGRQPRPKAGRKIPAFDSIHDQWLHALSSPDGKMDVSEDEIARFSLQIKDWRRPAIVSAASPFRLCFRLDEPEPGEEETVRTKRSRPPEPEGDLWAVRYFLQALDDPSLIVPAEYAWKAPGGRRASSVLKREDFNPREYLLSALAQAGSLCPDIEASLKVSIPKGYSLDTRGAFEFLTERAWALEQAGFGVLLPAWWTRKGTKLKLSAKANVKSPKMQAKAGLSLDTIVQFNWEVALGGEPLTLKELEELARLKSPLVKIRGQWVELNAEEIQTALEFWKNRAQEKITAREVLQMALGARGSVKGIAFEGVKAGGWIANVLSELEGRTPFKELPSPDGFRGSLRPYQIRGYSWLSFLKRWGLGACLADDMGLGKTIQTLALIEKEWASNAKRPVLLICPMSVVNNWQKEASRFTPDLPVMIHHGSARSKGRTFKSEAMKSAIVISSYSLLHRDFEILKAIKWAGIVLDEAQNIKNPETKQAKAARALEADYRIALTGTPVENNVGDLWSLMEFLNPGFLGSLSEFRRSFFIPIQTNRDAEAVERLRRLTGPFILRRLKTDKAIITDLPEKMEMKVFCPLTKEQASLYEAVVKDVARALDSAEGIQRKGIVLATLSKLKQVCNHPAQFLGDNSAISGRSGKLARLTEMLEEIMEIGERVIIFSQFTEMGEILKRYLQDTFGREVLFLHGGIQKKQRDRMIERFQAEENAPAIFILSLKAGGTGLNLTQANHVFHFDRWWNPAVENQATDRAFRIGQTKNVQVHKFICAGTLEEKIDEMIEKKTEISQGVIGAGEAWLTELSTTELRELFALGKDAVGE